MVLSRMAGSVRDYVSENKNADYHSIVSRFGHPREIAAVYVSEMQPEEILSSLDIRGRVLRIVLVSSALVAFVWISMFIAGWRNYINSIGGYYTEEIVIVERIEYD